ncbi:MAG: hypothetical protein Q7K54_00265 [Candidatus Parcubacteria bacterium]|nr:hypothetical protein [Candidatus Parcubacteria bacterium]
MDFLISFYDNSLIYYPNIFFAALFFVSILGIILIGILTIFLGKKIKKIIEEIRSNLKQIGKIKKEEGNKTPFTRTIKVFVQKASIFSIYIIRALTIILFRIVRVFFILMNKTIECFELHAEKIAKKIEKEVFVKE